MLYDNALLLGVYTHWWRRTGDPLASGWSPRPSTGCCGEMRTDGGRASPPAWTPTRWTTRADLREGAFYVWNPDQLTRCSAPRTGRWAAEVVPGDRAGHLRGRPSRRCSSSLIPIPSGSPSVRARLLAARERAAATSRDDKVVAAWNGWLIDSLVQAADDLRPPGLAGGRRPDRRRACCGACTGSDGRLRRASRDGAVGDRAGDRWRTTRRWPRPVVRLAAATGDAGLAGPGRELLAAVIRSSSTTGSGILRHGRRRRAALHPAAGSDRQRDAVRAQRGGARAARCWPS